MSADCCSEQVQIVFSALHSTISEIGDKAVTWQGRNVTGHVARIVSGLTDHLYFILFILRCMMFFLEFLHN